MWWVRKDICGLFSASFTVLLLLYAQFVIVTVVIIPWYGYSIHVPIYTAITLLALVSHCRAQFTNPGAIPLDRVPPAVQPVLLNQHGQEIPVAPPRVCRRCKVLKPYKAHHCSTCGRCIIRMDHHCPWVNNCVAIFNQKYFLLFLIYTALCCIYSGVLLVGRFISCTNNLKQCSISGVQTILCVLNFIEAIIFGLFCLIMLWDQLSAIFENTPGIDALQNKKGESRGRYESLQEVFGEKLNWRWWLPLELPKRVEKEFELECAELIDPMEEELREIKQQKLNEKHYQQQLQLQQQQESVMQQQLHTNGGVTNSSESHSIADLHPQYGRFNYNSSSPLHLNGPIVFPDSMMQQQPQPPQQTKQRHPIESLMEPSIDERDSEELDHALDSTAQSPPHSSSGAAAGGLQPRMSNSHKSMA